MDHGSAVTSESKSPDGTYKRPRSPYCRRVSNLSISDDADVIAEALAARGDVEDAEFRRDSRTWRDRLSGYPADAKLTAAKTRSRRALDELARNRVGADPEHWGLLSENTERALSELVKRNEVPAEVAKQLRNVCDHLPDARISACDGLAPSGKAMSPLVDLLTEKLAATLELEMDDAIARKILHHLPGSARPIPSLNRQLIAVDDSFFPRYFHYRDPRVALRTFTVSYRGADELQVHDIVVDRKKRSQGIGSAALQHLCRTADHYGFTLTGEINPGPLPQQPSDLGIRPIEAASARLAGWYRHHDFEIVPSQEGSFYCAVIKRAPVMVMR
jgi:GNAT superfamily N-acetyltransferase